MSEKQNHEIPRPGKPVPKSRKKQMVKDCLARVIDANRAMLADVVNALN